MFSDGEIITDKHIIHMSINASSNNEQTINIITLNFNFEQ